MDGLSLAQQGFLLVCEAEAFFLCGPGSVAVDLAGVRLVEGLAVRVLVQETRARLEGIIPDSENKPALGGQDPTPALIYCDSLALALAVELADRGGDHRKLRSSVERWLKARNLPVSPMWIPSELTLRS